MELVVVLAIALAIWGGLGYAIWSHKGQNPWAGLVVGLALSPISTVGSLGDPFEWHHVERGRLGGSGLVLEP